MPKLFASVIFCFIFFFQMQKLEAKFIIQNSVSLSTQFMHMKHFTPDKYEDDLPSSQCNSNVYEDWKWNWRMSMKRHLRPILTQLFVYVLFEYLDIDFGLLNLRFRMLCTAIFKHISNHWIPLSEGRKNCAIKVIAWRLI